MCSLPVEGHSHAALADYQLLGEKMRIRTYAFSDHLPRAYVLISNLIYPH